MVPPDSSAPPAEPTVITPAAQHARLDMDWVRRAAVTVLLLVVGLWIGAWMFGRLGSFLFLLLLAWLMGIAMDPIVNWLGKFKIKRAQATLLVMFLGFVGTVVFFAAFGSLLVDQLVQLISSTPKSMDEAVNWANQSFGLHLNSAEIQQKLNVSPQQVAGWASNLAGGVLGLVSSVVGVIFSGFTMLLFAFYFAAEGPRARDTVASWLPSGKQEVFNTVWDLAVQKTGGFVVSRLLLALLSSFCTGIFFLLLGVPYWLPMALWVGLVSQFIPTIGTYLAIALPVLVVVFNDPWMAVWIIVFATAYQQIENYYFAPKISSKTMDIHPAVAFASVIVGAALFGPLGALIGIPLAAMILAIADTYGKRYELVTTHTSTDGQPTSADSETQPT